MVDLRPITEENFEECINLDVKTEQQDYIAENLCSIAEAYVAMTSGETVPMPYGIYDSENDTMVGFLMIGYNENGDEDLPEAFYCIWRIMIDANCQEIGYGHDAMEKALELDLMAEVLDEQVRLLSQELRTTTQRVNLFEKVKIPDTKKNIRKINVFLADEQVAAVVRSKISKKKLQVVIDKEEAQK